MIKRAVHPGEVLKDELEEMGISPTTGDCALALTIGIPSPFLPFC